MIARPIVYFEVSSKVWSEYFDARLRRAGVIKYDPRSRKPTDPQVYVSILFVPDRQSSAYRVYATRDRKISIQVRDRVEVFRNQVLHQFRHSGLTRWLEIDRIKSGLFFSEGKEERVLLSAETGGQIFYRATDSPAYFERLGPVNNVIVIKTGLILGGEDHVAIKRTVDSLTLPYPYGKYRPSQIAATKPVVDQPVVSVQTLTWEILPRGWWSFYRVVGKSKKKSKVLSAEELQRIEFINSLGSPTWYSGSHLGERIYFVALFGDLAVADCPEFGNALYYYKGKNWQEVFRLSKRDALNNGASRIVHIGDWQSRLRELLEPETVSV